MVRVILGVIVGFALWSLLWLGTHWVLFADEAIAVSKGEPLTRIGPLLGMVGVSIICSLAAGACTGAIARSRKPVWAQAFILLAVGAPIQASAWNLMPIWYHATFLALLVPATLLGGAAVAKLDRT
jgi:hypothetical protein